jgi:hypothetical protein
VKSVKGGGDVTVSFEGAKELVSDSGVRGAVFSVAALWVKSVKGGGDVTVSFEGAKELVSDSGIGENEDGKVVNVPEFLPSSLSEDGWESIDSTDSVATAWD